MDKKDLRNYKNFTKDYVHVPTEQELEYVKETLNKIRLPETIFFIFCTIIAIAGTIVFTIDAFTHSLLQYNYIAIIFALFFCVFAVCYTYDTICRLKENVRISKGDFLIAHGTISEILTQSARNTEVKFICDENWEDNMIHKLGGVSHKKNDRVILVALFNKDDILTYRTLIKNEMTDS